MLDKEATRFDSNFAGSGRMARWANLSRRFKNGDVDVCGEKARKQVRVGNGGESRILTII